MHPFRGIAVAASLVGALLTLACGGAASPPSSYPSAQQEAQTAAQEVLRQGGATSLGIALVTRDRVVWAESYGFADLEKQRVPSATTMFGIGSSSKMFATVAVMQLVEQGLVKLDEPLVRYLPSFRMADPRYTAITVRMLLNHSSGFPGSNYRNVFTTKPASGYADQVLAGLANERLKAAPGYMSVYCNDGFTVVESLVKALTGKAYADYVQAAILDPLGMQHSAYTGAPFPDDSYAKAYRAGIVQPQEFIGPQASGGLYSTPTDMAAFARMILNGGALGSTRILSPASLDAMAVDQTVGTFNPVKSGAWSYGLGWDTVREPGLQAVGIAGWSKGGDTNHYGAELMFAPGAGLAVVVMGTQGVGYVHGTLAQRVLLRALAECGAIPAFPAPLAPVASPVAAPSPGLADAAVGVYATYNNLIQVLKDTDDSLLILRLGPTGFVPLTPGVKLRTDGWFTSDAMPLTSCRVVTASGVQYLANRTPGGAKHYLDQLAFGQRLQVPAGPLAEAWSRRVGSVWLLVNESPDSHVDQFMGTRQLTLTTLPELPGLVIVWPSEDTPAPFVVDPSGSEATARMMLVIPGMNGRDMNDLDVVVRGGEEWLRWGDAMHRPLATVPVLPAGASTRVPIGPEGYAEWRTLRAGTVPVRFSVSGAVAWRLYDPDFNLLASGTASGQGTLPAGTGPGYLLLFGTAGGGVVVEVP
jgi:CubicO group peptidase (beta-lactamase class C family)